MPRSKSAPPRPVNPPRSARTINLLTPLTAARVPCSVKLSPSPKPCGDVSPKRPCPRARRRLGQPSPPSLVPRWAGARGPGLNLDQTQVSCYIGTVACGQARERGLWQRRVKGSALPLRCAPWSIPPWCTGPPGRCGILAGRQRKGCHCEAAQAAQVPRGNTGRALDTHRIPTGYLPDTNRIPAGAPRNHQAGPSLATRSTRPRRGAARPGGINTLKSKATHRFPLATAASPTPAD